MRYVSAVSQECQLTCLNSCRYDEAGTRALSFRICREREKQPSNKLESESHER